MSTESSATKAAEVFQLIDRKAAELQAAEEIGGSEL